MKHYRLLILFTALSLVLVACGGGAATQVPGGATTNPGDGGGTPTDVPQATNGPGATLSGGGGGGVKPAGWDQYGKVHIELSGPRLEDRRLRFRARGQLLRRGRGFVAELHDRGRATRSSRS